jgi:hypothetical protein
MSLRCSSARAPSFGMSLYASRYARNLFAISRYGSRVVVSEIPKYPSSNIV